MLWVGGPVSNGHGTLASAHYYSALPVQEPLRLDPFSIGPNEHPGGSLLWFHKGQGRSLKSTGPPRPASASRRLMMTAMAASSLLGLLDPGSSMMSILRWELSPADGDSFCLFAWEYFTRFTLVRLIQCTYSLMSYLNMGIQLNRAQAQFLLKADLECHHFESKW